MIYTVLFVTRETLQVAVAEDAAACGVALDAGLLQDLVFVLERRAPDLARRFGPKLAGAPRGPADARRPATAAGARFQRRA